MKKRTTDNTTIYEGKKFRYAYSKGKQSLLFIKSISIPPTAELISILPVRDKKTAEQIIKLLEKPVKSQVQNLRQSKEPAVKPNQKKR